MSRSATLWAGRVAAETLSRDELIKAKAAARTRVEQIRVMMATKKENQVVWRMRKRVVEGDEMGGEEVCAEFDG